MFNLQKGDATQRWPLEDGVLDSVVTDPPYGIAFMGKSWDDLGGPQAYQEWTRLWAAEAFRCLKPGGYLLAFCGTRTYHRMACGIEDVGFNVRDMIEWLYLSGFPKSMDVSKQFDKQVGAEREVVGPDRGRLIGGKGGTSTNHGRGGVKYGIDAPTAPATDLAKRWNGWGTALKPAHEPIVMARKPLEKTVCYNVEKYGTGALNIGATRIGNETIKCGNAYVGNDEGRYGWNNGTVKEHEGNVHEGRHPANCVTVEEDEWYSKYFNITPQVLSKKASKKDRGEGNNHPTVKPLALIRWLQRLVTPPGGITASPFLGSGTDAVAAIHEGFAFFGLEWEDEYWPTINARVTEARHVV